MAMVLTVYIFPFVSQEIISLKDTVCMTRVSEFYYFLISLPSVMMFSITVI